MQITTTNEWDVIPPELRNTPNWCGVKLGKTTAGKINKFPVDAKTGDAARSNDPTTWCDFETAVQCWMDNRYDALMVRLPENVGMIDFDKMPNIRDEEEVNRIVRQCGSFADYSVSDRGLHIIGYIDEPIPTPFCTVW
jgi:putative DNA primase/helicase